MHDAYDWAKDIVVPLVTGGGAVVVGVAALRVANRGHELAAAADERAVLATQAAGRQRVAGELLEWVRARQRYLSAPTPEPEPGLLLGGAVVATEAQDLERNDDDILASASTLSATLDDQDRVSFRWLENYLLLILSAGNRKYVDVMAETANVTIEHWVREPQAVLARLQRDWPDLDPEDPVDD